VQRGAGAVDPGVAVGFGVVLDQPLRRVLTPDPKCLREDLGRGRGRREPDHGPRSVLGLPRGPEGGEGPGLTRAGRADEHVHHPPGGGDRGDGGGLVGEEPRSSCHGGWVERGAVELAAGGQEAVLGVEQALGGVPLCAVVPQRRRPVAAAERRRDGGGFRWGEQHGPAGHLGHDGRHRGVALGRGSEPVVSEGSGDFGVDVPRRPRRPLHRQDREDLLRDLLDHHAGFGWQGVIDLGRRRGERPRGPLGRVLAEDVVGASSPLIGEFGE